MPTNDPLDPSSTTVRTVGPEIPGPLGEEGWGSDGEPDEQVRPSSSSTTTPSQVFTAEAAAFYEGMIGTGLEFAGVMAHHRVDPDNATTLWLMSEGNLVDIAQPLARILARHTPIESGKANDAADAISAGIGAAGYVVENLRAQAEYAAQVHAAAAAGGEQE
jgi:hypothetical protein